MFNTAVTRAKQWLVVVGEPFTLCTVGENRMCWMELIRCCQQIGSFDFINADQFVEEALDHKIVVRQVLEKVHSSFFGPNRVYTITQGTAAPTHTLTQGTAAPTHTLTQGTAALTPSTETTYAAMQPQQRVELLRSKVKQSTQNDNEVIINKITGVCMYMYGGYYSAHVVRGTIQHAHVVWGVLYSAIQHMF